MKRGRAVPGRSSLGRVRLWPLLLGVLGLLGALGAAAAWWLQQPLALPRAPLEFEVEPGQSPRQVVQGLVDSGVQVQPVLLYQWFRWSGQARQIRAGSYELEAGTTPRELLRKLVAGDETLARLRLIEGWTFRQVRAELQRTPGLKRVTDAMSDAELMAALGAPGLAPEGRFFPDTYAFAKGSSDLAVLQRAHAAMNRRLEAVWAQRPPDLPLQSPEQLLTLASIVEKETGRAADRGLVASVFLNRLRIGMPLQTDPTVIYGLGEAFDGNLRKRDLQTDTPFNTYTRRGLPPTPIAMPGRDALWAVVRPTPSKALYFVARGDGSSEFSETLADHNRAVDKYQRNRDRQP
ncbi:MAG: endolytic transglycosylase MltG [Burkholderiaceae bacterium]|nr:endolytic transglycosylase MltG [Burkholderiaceae bacterium]